MRYFVVIFVIGWFLGATTLLIPSVTKHGCASPIPPTVTGPLVQPTTTYHTLLINEVLLAPHSTWNCSELAGKFTASNDTWLEIYNPSPNQAFDLYTSHAQLDSGPNTNAFLFPFGTAIPPSGFLTVFPLTDPSFQISALRDFRLLIMGIPIDEVTVPPLSADTSYARIPDGSATWQITTTPTIASTNLLVPLPTKTPTPSRKATTSLTNATTGSTQDALPPTLTDIASGTQPSWKDVQMPMVSTLTTLTPDTGNITNVAHSQVTPNLTNFDLSKKVVLTVLSVLLVSVLLWCFRIFMRT